MPQSYTTEGLSVNRSEALSPAVPVQRPLFRRSAATYNPCMKRWLPIYLTLLAVSSLGASTLDVSADTSVLVHSGDTLVFHLLTSNFSGNAARLGVSRSPSQLDFTLVSAPGVGPVEFAATLESTAGSLAFGDVIFHSGYFQGSGYSGEISTLQGRVELPPPLSETLFEASTTIVLALRNEGPDEIGRAHV